jgi:hypothetical protein
VDCALYVAITLVEPPVPNARVVSLGRIKPEISYGVSNFNDQRWCNRYVDSVQRTASISSGLAYIFGRAAVQEVNFRSLVGFLPFHLSRLCSLRVSIGFDTLYYCFSSSHAEHVSCRGILLRCECCGAPQFVTQFFLTRLQLLDVLNAHFQQVFGINKLQSTMLQLAYFVGTVTLFEKTRR